ncbi:hypothetical protein, partial [Moorena bouillonii]|uniref:hypothetical protein n=1 Tax=Moorena bouillonii TaxID=207920 RepID=UPI001BDFF5BE
ALSLFLTLPNCKKPTLVRMGRWGDGEMGSDWLGFYGADKVLPIDYKTECCFLITPRNNPLVSSSSLLPIAFPSWEGLGVGSSCLPLLGGVRGWFLLPLAFFPQTSHTSQTPPSPHTLTPVP